MRRVLAALLCLLLNNCSSSDPTLFTLGQRPGTPRPTPPWIVAVRDVTVARYLERQGIVRREGNRLVVSDHDWWGETVAAMVRRVLAADLQQRLPGANVLATDGIGGDRPNTEIELDLQRFDADGVRVVLEGLAAISAKDTPRVLVKIAEQTPLNGRDATAQVDAMSDVLGHVADAIAARVAR